MYLDTDVYFSMFNLSYLFRAMEQIDNEYYILNSQLLRLWDESWNMISNDRYIPMGYDSKIWLKYDPFKLDSEVFQYSSTIGIREKGEGYTGAHGFEMLVAEDFGNYVESVSKDIFGDQEPIVFPDSAATLRSKGDK